MFLQENDFSHLIISALIPHVYWSKNCLVATISNNKSEKNNE